MATASSSPRAEEPVLKRPKSSNSEIDARAAYAVGLVQGAQAELRKQMAELQMQLQFSRMENAELRGKVDAEGMARLLFKD